MQFPWRLITLQARLAGMLLLISVLGRAGTLIANEPAPCVHFDAAQVVAGIPVTWPGEHPLTVTAQSIATSDDEMLIDAAFDVSTLIRFGRESQLVQLLFVIESPNRSLRVVDFAPRTELTTSYAGQIESSQQRERSTGAGLNATLSPVEMVTAQANASKAAKSIDNVRFRSRPPMELLTASGTVARGTAVYFKFRSTPQTTLEGNRELRVMFRVPRNWRADYVYLRCAAYDQHALRDHARPICGSSEFLVPIYLAGDELAKEAAQQLASADFQLKIMARNDNAQRTRPGDDSWTTKLNGLLSVARHKPKPKAQVPDKWLSQVLTSPTNKRSFDFQQHLPPATNEALSAFLTARWQLVQLNN